MLEHNINGAGKTTTMSMLTGKHLPVNIDMVVVFPAPLCSNIDLLT
jgi:ABC-type uncharacterized transport system ATPase subunit